MLRQCSEYHRSYADILYSWQLLDQRAEILKFQVTRTLDTIQQQIGFANLCKVCGAKVQGPACKTSHCFAFNCSICNLSVKGKGFTCLFCCSSDNSSQGIQEGEEERGAEGSGGEGGKRRGAEGSGEEGRKEEGRGGEGRGGEGRGGEGRGGEGRGAEGMGAEQRGRGGEGRGGSMY